MDGLTTESIRVDRHIKDMRAPTSGYVYQLSSTEYACPAPQESVHGYTKRRQRISTRRPTEDVGRLRRARLERDEILDEDVQVDVVSQQRRLHLAVARRPLAADVAREEDDRLRRAGAEAEPRRVEEGEHRVRRVAGLAVEPVEDGVHLVDGVEDLAVHRVRVRPVEVSAPAEADDGVADVGQALGAHALVEVVGKLLDLVEKGLVALAVLGDEDDVGDLGDLLEGVDGDRFRVVENLIGGWNLAAY